MSRFGVQALPTTPYNVPQSQVNDPAGLNYVSVSLRNTSTTTTHTVTLLYVGDDERTTSLAPGAVFLRRNCPLSQIRVDSGSDVLAYIASEPEYEQPEYLTTITGTVTTDIGSANTYAKDATLTNGTQITAIEDAGGNKTLGPMTNGQPAPSDGNVSFYVFATSGAITLSDGTATKNTGLTGDNATWFKLSFPVSKGITYTIAGTGLVILGSMGFVGT